MSWCRARQFLAAFPTVVWIVLIVLPVAIACSAPSNRKDDAPKVAAKESPEESKRLYTGKGEATVRDPFGDRPIRYVVRWQSTQLDYTLEQGTSGGRLEKVAGELYREGKLASTFTADAATSDKAKNLLVLEGNVTAIGIDPKGRLQCQKLEWKTDEKLAKAFGKVEIKFGQGTIGPVDELWCLPDLKRAGTPGFYSR